MKKNPIGRPKKPENEKKITLTLGVKKKHKNIVKEKLKELEVQYGAN